MSAAALEHQAALSSLAGPRLDEGEPDGFVIVEDGVTFVCPLDLAARRYDALEDFREGLPPVFADAFIPADVAARVESAYAAVRQDEPDAQSHVLTARWQVPLR